MIRALSYFIASLLTVLLACLLYPVAALFWIAGKIGWIVGIIGDWVYEHANAAIKKMWEELREGQSG